MLGLAFGRRVPSPLFNGSPAPPPLCPVGKFGLKFGSLTFLGFLVSVSFAEIFRGHARTALILEIGEFFPIRR